MDYEYNIYDLADILADEIEEQVRDKGKTKWSAKDVKEIFLDRGINLSLDDILEVWRNCPNPICACELLGCDEAIMAEDDLYTHPKDIVDIELCDGSERGECADTFWMTAHTRDGEEITIIASPYSTCRYDATYTLKSSDPRKNYSDSIGIVSGQLEDVVYCLFDQYGVPEDLKQEIDNFVDNYY